MNRARRLLLGALIAVAVTAGSATSAAANVHATGHAVTAAPR
ncbi:hypothetical protein [Streptomyces purpureus]|nr:hypothetical protein [Streptomyces purpureus]